MPLGTHNDEVFEVYALGVCCASVCSNLPVPEMTKRLNAQHPTGLDHGWGFAADSPTFASGGPNPGKCERGTPGCSHYLFCC